MEPPDADSLKSASSTWDDILVWYFFGKISPNGDFFFSNWQKSSVL
jgi:hypothetical protein